MAIAVKMSLNISPQTLIKLIKNLDKLLDLKNESFVSEMGLNCYILILIEYS
jgi:DNA-binding CsgD family transcriptional regulator